MNAPRTTTDTGRRRMQRGALGIALAGSLVAGTAGFAFADGMPAPGGQATRSAAATDQSGTGHTTGSGTDRTAAAQGSGDAVRSGPAAGPGAKKHQPHLDGIVATIDGDTISIKDHDGFTRTIDATGVEQLQVQVGQHIIARGSVDSDGTTLNATTLTQAPKPGEAPKPPKAGEAPKPPKAGEAPKPPKAGEAPKPPKAGEAPKPPKPGDAPEPPKADGAPAPSESSAPSDTPSASAPTTNG